MPLLGWLFLVTQIVLMPAALVFKRSQNSRELEVSDLWANRALLAVFVFGVPLTFLEILALHYGSISARVVIDLLGLAAFVFHVCAWGLAIYYGVKAWDAKSHT